MALTQISTDGIKNGTITGSDLATNIDLVDNQKIRFGTGNDLQIYFDGTNSFIKEPNSVAGQLVIDGYNGTDIRRGATGDHIIRAIGGGSVELYEAGSKKFETKSDGVLASGSLTLTGQNTTHTAGGLALGYEGSHVHQIRTYGANTSNNGRLDLVSSRSDGTNSYTITLINHVGNLSIPDNQKLALGNGADLQIFHDGVDNHINASQTLSIKMGGETSAQFDVNGAVHLYHDNSKKFETTIAGINVEGSITADDIITAGALLHENDTDTLVHFSAANTIQLKTGGSSRLLVNNFGINLENGYLNSNGNRIILGDSSGATDDRIIFGNNNDLEIYHDGTASFIKNATGGLNLEDTGGYFRVKSDDIKLEAANGEDFLECDANGAVILYHDASKKFETTSDGVKISGAEGVEAILTFEPDEGDNASDKFRFRASDSAGFFLENGSSNDTSIKANFNGSVELYHANSKKFETTSTGATVTGSLNLGSGDLLLTGNVDLEDSTGGGNNRIKLGASDDLQIYHNGTDDVIHSTGTSLRTRSNIFRANNAANNKVMFRSFSDGAFEAYHNGNKKFETTSDGALVAGGLNIMPGSSSFVTVNKEGTGILVSLRTTGTERGNISSNGSTVQFNTSSSDKSMKKNFEDWTENTLSLFKNINPQRFNFLDQEDGTDKEKGFIAQDLVTSFPEAYPKINDKYMFNPSAMVVYLMKAIQELEAEVAALKAA